VVFLRLYNAGVKQTCISAVLCIAAAAMTWATMNISQEPLKLERLDSAVDQLVPKDAQLEKLATGFKWTEGPVWIPAGYLLFAEIPSNSIRKWSPGQKTATIFLQPSGYRGSEPYGGPEPGSNGMTLDPRGRLTVAGHAQRDVWRLETMDPHGQATILADSYEGKKLNSPNDLVYKSDGALYFTDPPYGFRTQSDKDPDKQLAVNGVYRLPRAAAQPPGAPPANSKLELLIKDMPRPNGIAFSPDEKVLYVNNSEPKFWKKYAVSSDGAIGEGKTLYDATSDAREGAPDGMKVDTAGNLFSTGPGGIWIFSPAGRHIGTLLMPEKAGNLAWGDDDYRTLYITASASVYRVRLNTTGIRPR
jgi:gluconolactonase